MFCAQSRADRLVRSGGSKMRAQLPEQLPPCSTEKCRSHSVIDKTIVQRFDVHFCQNLKNERRVLAEKVWKASLSKRKNCAKKFASNNRTFLSVRQSSRLRICYLLGDNEVFYCHPTANYPLMFYDAARTIC